MSIRLKLCTERKNLRGKKAGKFFLRLKKKAGIMSKHGKVASLFEVGCLPFSRSI